MALRLAVLAGDGADPGSWAAEARRAGAELLLLPGGDDGPAVLQGLAIRHGLWLCSAVASQVVLIRADGALAWQGQGAGPFQVFATPWGLLGLADGPGVEFPKPVRAQVEAGAWLVLVPGRQHAPREVERRRVAVRARAMENRCFVATACGPDYAGIHGPLEAPYPEDGILTASGAAARPCLLLADLDAAALGAVRHTARWPASPLPRPEPAAWH